MKARLFAVLLMGVSLACQALTPPPLDPAPGISQELARHRSVTLDDVRYEVRFEIPENTADPVSGHLVVRFRRTASAGPLVLDFARDEGHVRALRVVRNQKSVETDYKLRDGHLVVPTSALFKGENAVEIEFFASDASLNRREGYLYTLFVPDRAHHAFPCFDQPDLKARFLLTLETPEGWLAVANGALVEEATSAGRTTRVFAPTEPLPSYLFAFAAGEFQVEKATRGNRTLRFFHRETDAAKVERNRKALFDLHAKALSWLEAYTAIPYPFGKFDFVLLPGFQFGGIEHPGAGFYRDNPLLLDATATQNDRLRRASLIAQFGDLATMPWFGDVWMKEVFANFMAARIVHPSFPDVDHALRFLLAHFPSAYEIDLSAGAHPIRQELTNLNEAGNLYGPIIYQKAPIVMRQLELLLGEDALRAGLRQYLEEHRFGNTSWEDLIAALDPRTEVDLASWSRVWVGKAGRATIGVLPEIAGGRLAALRLTQTDPAGRDRLWNQRIGLVLGAPATGEPRPPLETILDAPSLTLKEARDQPSPTYVLHDGLAYGRFELDSGTRDFLLGNLAEPEEPLLRGVSWLTLWDEMLEGRLSPPVLFEAALAWLAEETNELLITQLLDDLEELYWRFVPPELAQGRLDSLLWQLLERAPQTSLKASYFRTWTATAARAGSLSRLERLLRGELVIAGLPLSEEDEITLAWELAVRDVPGASELLDAQLQRLENPDRRERFAFVMPAVASDPAVRGAFFASLADVRNREQERWVIEALGYLHHPLRARTSIEHIRPALEMVEEIQRTGDIFFPKSWLDAVLGGHSSPVAAEIVHRFLEQRPGYPPRLRGKILQSADGLMRAARIRRAMEAP